jgi:rare lipoprotein A
MFKMTAAHPTLPIPSYARVTHVASGKQVIVRINDRGPFHSGRIIDLSYTAALKLGYVGRGSGEIEVERLLPDEIARMSSNRNGQAQAAQTSAVPEPVAVVEVIQPVVQAIAFAAPTAQTPPVVPLPAAPEPQSPAAQPVGQTANGLYLQLGAYTQVSNAEAVRARLAAGWDASLPALQVVQSGNWYRIYSGPYANRAEADLAARRIEAAGPGKPLIVQR